MQLFDNQSDLVYPRRDGVVASKG